VRRAFATHLLEDGYDTYATSQWGTLCVYLTDGRLTIDNAPAEQAVRCASAAATGCTWAGTAVSDRRPSC
jgi:hypothetical protein